MTFTVASQFVVVLAAIRMGARYSGVGLGADHVLNKGEREAPWRDRCRITR